MVFVSKCIGVVAGSCLLCLGLSIVNPMRVRRLSRGRVVPQTQ